MAKSRSLDCALSGFSSKLTISIERGAIAVTDLELRKLSRQELLTLLVAVSRERDALRAELDAAHAALADRQLQIDEAGTLAEAALRLNGVFDAAQAAAQQYLDNARARSEQTEQLCALREEECRHRCNTLEQEARRRVELYREQAIQQLRELSRDPEKLRRVAAGGGHTR